MSEKYGFSTFLWATGSFIGGLAVGALLTPKSGHQNRAIISRHSADVGHWVDQQRKKLRLKSRKELRNIRRNVEGSFRRNIPDLYEATAQIDLSGHELN